jgi:hypothetical protein
MTAMMTTLREQLTATVEKPPWRPPSRARGSTTTPNHQLPGGLEQQDREHLDGVPQAEERQQRHRGEQAEGDPFVHRQVVRARQLRPPDEREADAHQEVATAHGVQPCQGQVRTCSRGNVDGCWHVCSKVMDNC